MSRTAPEREPTGTPDGPSIPKLVRDVIGVVDSATRRNLYLALPVSLILAVFETFGFALIFPFLEVLADPDALDSGGVLSDLYDLSGANSRNQFLAILGVAIFSALTLKALLAIGYLRWQSRVLAHAEASMSSRLFSTYLRLPYPFHLEHHSAELIRNIQTAVSLTAWQFLLSLTQFVADVVVLVAIIATLLLIDPLSALAAGGVLGIAGVGYLLLYARRSRRLGARELHLQRQIQQLLQEGLAGIKVIKVLGREVPIGQQQSNRRWELAETREKQQFANNLPRYLLETALTVALALVVAIVLSLREGPEAIASLGLLAAGALRLLPALQRVLSEINIMQMSRPSAALIANELSSLEFAAEADRPTSRRPRRFSRSLILDDVSFRYSLSGPDAISNIHLELQRGESLGLVGPSGAGKTTVADIVLGLLIPTGGRILVDGAELTSSEVPGWRQLVGYVPQEVFLFDDTLRRNIALGLEGKDVDDDSLQEAIHLAQLDGVVDELPLGADTPLGEGGARLSGGQRQRVGIARALYTQPEILVLDEATSALDSLTEAAIASTVDNLRGRLTMIVIAHRLSTVQRCDSVAYLDAGRVKVVGSFDDLSRTHPEFGKLVRAAGLLSPSEVG